MRFFKKLPKYLCFECNNVSFQLEEKLCRDCIVLYKISHTYLEKAHLKKRWCVDSVVLERKHLANLFLFFANFFVVNKLP
jgi:hypothetical protein